MSPSASTPPIVVAVWLGCTTAARLAHEWSITPCAARARLRDACRLGLITRRTRGVYYRSNPARFQPRTVRIGYVRPLRRFSARKTA